MTTQLFDTLSGTTNETAKILLHVDKFLLN